ncbi:MAG: hypothetical protein R3C53_02640 [Pirellulaceae bacterium]
MAKSKQDADAQVVARIVEGKVRGPLSIEGSLDLSKTAIKKLPSGLNCYELDASETNLIDLPADLTVESRLVLKNCEQLKRLPPGLTVGTLDLEGCTALAELPEGLDVWFLNVSGCRQLKSLPKKAKIRNGSLNVGGCFQLEGLPNYLKKLGTLDVSDCPKIRRLPSNLEVGLWIDVGGSGMTGLHAPNEQVGLRWRGVTIDRRIAFSPETITADEVLKQKNTELRRVLIERMGAERFMRDANPKVIDRDQDAGGERQLLRLPMENDEDFVCLSCSCPSTARHYLLRVPPTMRSCHQAAAWMAGFDDPKKYKPVIET